MKGVAVPAWPRLARLWAFSFGAMVVWSRLGVLLHETAGHALVWRAGGGTVRGIEVSLFGGGMTRTAPEATTRAPWFLFHMGGILVNLLLGTGLGAALVCLLVGDEKGRKGERDPPAGPKPLRTSASSVEPRGEGPPAPRRLLTEHLLAWGVLLNLAGATHYTVLGAFYEFGDPAPYHRLWGPAMALLVIATPVTFHLWARTLRPLLREKSVSHPFSRAPLGLTGLVVAAVPLIAYVTGLAIESRVEDTSFRALRAESVAVARAVEEEKARRLDEWRAEHGDREPPPEVTEVTAEDVKRPFPLTALVLGLDVAFLGAALFRRRLTPMRAAARPNSPSSSALPQEAPSVPWAWPLAAAATVLLVVHVVL